MCWGIASVTIRKRKYIFFLLLISHAQLSHDQPAEPLLKSLLKANETFVDRTIKYPTVSPFFLNFTWQDRSPVGGEQCRLMFCEICSLTWTPVARFCTNTSLCCFQGQLYLSKFHASVQITSLTIQDIIIELWPWCLIVVWFAKLKPIILLTTSDIISHIDIQQMSRADYRYLWTCSFVVIVDM